MNSERPANWRHTAFLLVMGCCAQFVVLTGLAMLVYSGGSHYDSSTARYLFFGNFFSDLGLTVTYRGESNQLPMILFWTALTLAGLGLILFFFVAPGVYSRPGVGRILAIMGSSLGIISGLAFIGVAFTPANLLRQAHEFFVFIAFSALLGAVLLYIGTILLNPAFRGAYLAVLGLFTVLLGAYVWLILNGPGFDTVQGFRIQVVGQKIIVYAAIATVWVEAYGAWRMTGEGRTGRQPWPKPHTPGS